MHKRTRKYLYLACTVTWISCSNHPSGLLQEISSEKDTLVNLSTDARGRLATANSYLVPCRKSGRFKFNATVMGNGAVTPQMVTVQRWDEGRLVRKTPAIVPSELHPFSAFLIWETGRKGSVIKEGSVELKNGFVYFITSEETEPGNALIGVADCRGNLLWSWHIWRTDYNPDKEYRMYEVQKVTSASRINVTKVWLKLMQFNLGSLPDSQGEACATNHGLFYQWGRKDPFLQGKTVKVTLPIELNRKQSMAYATENPTHLILNNPADVTGSYDWVNLADASKRADNLWGTRQGRVTVPFDNIKTKSIYDPCPAGWQVPFQDYNVLLKQVSTNAAIQYRQPVSGTLCDNYWKNYFTDYIVSKYYIDGISGQLVRNEKNSGTWSATTCNNGAYVGNYLNGEGDVVYSFFHNSRASALPVRCMKEYP